MRHGVKLLLVIAAILALVVAGCTSETTTVTQTTTKTTTTTATSTTTTIPTPTGPYGTLRVAIENFGRETMDPASNTWSASGPILAAMYDSLFRHSVEGELIPGIVETWEMASDGMSWTFNIREGVTFHNGEALTAEDVVFSLERFLHKEAKSPFTGTLKANVESVEQVGEYTVKVTTTATLPFFPNTLSLYLGPEGMVMPKDYITDGAGGEFADQKAFIDGAPVGSGPWKYVDHAKGDFIELVAVEGHWRVTPAFEKLIIYLVPEDATRVAMLKAGEVDFVGISPDRKAEIEAAGLGILRSPNALNPGINFFGTYVPEAADKPTSNLKVRQALSLAINRDELIEFLLHGEGEPSLPRGVFFSSIDVDVPYFQAYAEDAYRYDQDEAKRLLAEAGYADGFDITLYTYPLTGRPWLSDIAEAVAAYWGQIGVNAQVVSLEYGAIRAQFKKVPPDEELWGMATTAQQTVSRMSIPTLGLQSTYHSAGTFRLLNDPDVDNAIDGPFRTMDAAQRAQMFNEVIEDLNDMYLSLPVFLANALYGVSAEIGDWQPVTGNVLVLGELFETIQHASK